MHDRSSLLSTSSLPGSSALQRTSLFRQAPRLRRVQRELLPYVRVTCKQREFLRPLLCRCDRWTPESRPSHPASSRDCRCESPLRWCAAQRWDDHQQSALRPPPENQTCAVMCRLFPPRDILCIPSNTPDRKSVV